MMVPGADDEELNFNLFPTLQLTLREAPLKKIVKKTTVIITTLSLLAGRQVRSLKDPTPPNDCN